jgi:hypothetical protein
MCPGRGSYPPVESSQIGAMEEREQPDRQIDCVKVRKREREDAANELIQLIPLLIIYRRRRSV